MSADYAPGTVFLATIQRWPAAQEWPDVPTTSVLVRVDDDGRAVSAVDGDPAAPLCVVQSRFDYITRLTDPLRVLADDEVAVKADDLRRIRKSAVEFETRSPLTATHIVAIDAALDAYDAACTPQIKEPQGQGAVIETANGERWVRSHAPDCEDGSGCIPWSRPQWGTQHQWHEVTEASRVVRVLFEGVTA